MATFTPLGRNALRPFVADRKRGPMQERALSSARKRAEQRLVAAELRAAISDAGLKHADLEAVMGLRPGRLSEHFMCNTVWDVRPEDFRAIVLQAIAEVTE